MLWDGSHDWTVGVEEYFLERMGGETRRICQWSPEAHGAVPVVDEEWLRLHGWGLKEGQSRWHCREVCCRLPDQEDWVGAAIYGQLWEPHVHKLWFSISPISVGGKKQLSLSSSWSLSEIKRPQRRWWISITFFHNTQNILHLYPGSFTRTKSEKFSSLLKLNQLS